MNGAYYEFLALNNQLIVLDFPISKNLFAVVENKGKYKIQQYIYLGQYWDGFKTWYVLDMVNGNKRKRVNIEKEAETWFRTEEEARVSLWERTANKGGVK